MKKKNLGVYTDVNVDHTFKTTKSRRITLTACQHDLSNITYTVKIRDRR